MRTLTQMHPVEVLSVPVPEREIGCGVCRSIETLNDLAPKIVQREAELMCIPSACRSVGLGVIPNAPAIAGISFLEEEKKGVRVDLGRIYHLPAFASHARSPYPCKVALCFTSTVGFSRRLEA